MKKFTIFLSTFFLTTAVLAQSNIYNLTDTWNDAGTTFDAIKMDVTDTASQDDSKLLNLQVGSTSEAYISKTGSIFLEEKADADADVANYGQIWVDTATPNALYFTDDAGTDFQLGAGGGFTSFVDDETNHNYAIGSGALSSAAGSVQDTIAIGFNAGVGLSSWDKSTIIGSYAMGGGGDGGENLMMGFNAGYSLTGYFNTFIGAKGACSGATSVNRSLCISAGNNEMNFDNGSDDYQIAIGHEAGKVISGKMTPAQINHDITEGLTISGPSAYAPETTPAYQNAGNLILKMGDHATGGGTAGNVSIVSPADVTRFSVNEDGDFGGRLLKTDAANKNLAIGGSAPAGQNNVLIGSGAGDSLITGASNVAIGVDAASSIFNDEMFGSVIIGILSTGIDALYGTAVGAYAKVGGDYNVSIGYRAGYNQNAAADRNIVIGYEASDNLNYSGDNSIFIGPSVNAPNTSNDQLIIGNDASNSIVGYMGARTDVDYSGRTLQINGPSALAAAATNQDGGNLALAGGASATGGGTDGAVTMVQGSDATAVALFDISAISTGTTRTITIPDADVDLGNVSTGAHYSPPFDLSYSNSNNISVGGNWLAHTIGDYNMAFGFEAGDNVTSGFNNVFVGRGVASSSTYGSMTGSHNVLIGYTAGSRHTSGSYSTFIGGINAGLQEHAKNYYLVLGNYFNSTTRGYGIFGHTGALGDLDISDGLTVQGPSAYASATTNQNAGDLILKMGDHATGGGTAGKVVIEAPDGTDRFTVDEDGDFGGTTMLADVTNGNYAFGSTALDSITVGLGQDNIAVGTNAGTAISTGDQNIAIGTNALNQVSTSDKNIAIGYNAANKLTTSSFFNVIMGWGALNAATSNVNGNVGIGAEALYALGGSNTYNTAIGYRAGMNLTASNYSVIIGPSLSGISTTNSDQLVVSNGTHNAIAGYFGARSDVDYSGRDLKFTGPSAFASATTNLDGGTATISGGDGASGSAGDADGGNLILKGGTGYGTGDDGKVSISNVMNVAASFTVATLPTGAVGDIARITDGDAALAWGATAVNSGSGATPYLVWHNGTNWTILGK